MTQFSMKSLPLKNFARSYATRRAVKPPTKIIEPVCNSPNAEIAHLPDGVTFIHRPPPTTPSPFSTTVLPASPLLRPGAATAEPSSSTQQTTVPVPPRLRNERKFPNNRVLTDVDFAQMRELRASNPTHYTRTRLAKQFNCPPFLVAQEVPLDRKSKDVAVEKMEAQHEEIRSKWGEQKSMVKAVKKKRRELW